MIANNQIEIYKSNDNNIELHVKLENDTVWLNRQQLSLLFDRDIKTISKHIVNVFKEGELDIDSTVAKIATVQPEGNRLIKRNVEHYNLDLIISIGYRVNSKRGTQLLKAYLIEGVAINEKRLEQQNKELKVLHDGIRILSRVIEEKISNTESYDWLNHFREGLRLLDDYDHEALDDRGTHFTKTEFPSSKEYEHLINKMRSDIDSNLFGMLKDGGFDSAVCQIMQGHREEDFYPSLEEKAAMLLYLIVKNHAFVDGNKRIAAACFLLFLSRNGLLYTSGGKTVISNEALASLTLFVAESKPDEMETVKRLLVSVLNRNLG